MSMEGSIYFVTDGTGAVKIGFSGAPRLRMENLQTAHHRDLRLLAVLHEKYKADEEALHERFAHLRIRGEWFKGDPELTDFIGSIPLPNYQPIENPPEGIRMEDIHPAQGLIDRIRARSLDRAAAKAYELASGGIGWERESETVRDRWRANVKEVIAAYQASVAYT